mmetsp:Transcript_14490/g.36042  ORF Transcript_14490/g.36042 Transcript_14490/m.36042 type:complete len:305 (-) Transcript_14490:86-1000(-)
MLRRTVHADVLHFEPYPTHSGLQTPVHRQCACSGSCTAAQLPTPPSPLLGCRRPSVKHVLRQHVGGQLLVLVARKVRLHARLAVKAQGLQALDGRVVLRGQLHHHAAAAAHGGQHALVHALLVLALARLRQQLQELLLVAVDHLQQLRVGLAQLLQHGHQDLWVALHRAPQHLELRAVAQEVQRAAVTPRRAAATRTRGCGPAKHVEGLRVGPLSARALSCWYCGTTTCHSCCQACQAAHSSGRRCCGRWVGCRLGCCCLRDACHKVLHCTLRVVEGSAHGTCDLLPLKAHLTDIGDGTLQSCP